MATSPILAIAAKEFTEHVHSRRFQIALALSTLLLVTSIVTLAISYREDAAAYEVGQAGLQQSGRLAEFNQVAAEVAKVLRRPNPLSVFATGPGDDFRRNAEVGAFGGEAPQATGGSASPTNQRFEALDLGFVAVAVMTFMAVLFAYDAISGERERGTLKLLLANPVARDTVLLGKYLGGMASVLLPFAISLVIGLTVFQFLGIHLTGAEWTRLALIVALVVPLTSAFYLLGLLVSSMARRSGTSLLALLLVWLVLVFGAGNAAAAVAKSATHATSDADLLQEFQGIQEEERTRTEALQQEMFSLFGQPNGTDDPAVRARVNQLQEQMQDAFEASQEQRDAALQAARRQLDGQLQAAEDLAALSPAEAFRSLATGIARTDYWSFKLAREAADAYQREAERARAAWAEENGQPGGGGRFVTIAIGPGGAVRSGGPGFEAPAFEYTPQTAAATLASGAGVRDLLVLVAYNLAAFAGAWLAFTRYDVR
jgi:ABC-type transport system involved in multi-copper enzyme maturation permease subunit